MNAISEFNAQPLTMSSLEISKLVESNHADVRRSIERLGNKGVISLSPLAEVKVQRDDGTDKIVEQALVTAKGLARLSEMIESKFGRQLAVAE